MAENPEQYAKLAKEGLLLGFPVRIGGAESRPDNGIGYHSTIKAFDAAKDHPHTVHNIAQHLPLNPPDARNTQIKFDQFKDRLGNDVHVVTLHGNSADKLLEHNGKFAGMGFPMTSTWTPHISVDRATWDKLKEKNPQTAHEAGIEFGPAKLLRGQETLKTYHHEPDSADPKFPDQGDTTAKMNVEPSEDFQKSQPTYSAPGLKGIPTGKDPKKGPAFTSIPTRAETNVQPVATERQGKIAGLRVMNARGRPLMSPRGDYIPEHVREEKIGRLPNEIGTRAGTGKSFAIGGREPERIYGSQEERPTTASRSVMVPTPARTQKEADWAKNRTDINNSPGAKAIDAFNAKHHEIDKRIKKAKTPEEKAKAQEEMKEHHKNVPPKLDYPRKPRKSSTDRPEPSSLQQAGVDDEDVKAHEGFHDTMRNIEKWYGNDTATKIKSTMIGLFDKDSMEALSRGVQSITNKEGQLAYDPEKHSFNEELLNFARQAGASKDWKDYFEKQYGPEDARKHINNLKAGVKKAASYIRHLQDKHLRQEPQMLPLAASEDFSNMRPLMKPYVSEAQRRWAHTPTGKKALGGNAGVHEWDEATKGKRLPERVSKEEPLEKGWKEAAAGLGMAGALASAQPAAAKSIARHTPQMTAPQAQQVPSPYDHQRMLRTISQVESSGGKNTKHGVGGGAIHGNEHAFGSYGLMPETIREIIKGNKDLAAKHAKALALKGENFNKYMADHKGLEDQIADRHLAHLEKHFGQDPDTLGYAWLNGIVGTHHAKDKGVDIKNHWHVKKIRDAYGKVR